MIQTVAYVATYVSQDASSLLLTLNYQLKTITYDLA